MQRRREAAGPGAAATDGRESAPPSVVGSFGRGVYAAAGRRRIVFRFQPLSQRIGMAISLALAGVILLLRARRGGNDAALRQ